MFSDGRVVIKRSVVKFVLEQDRLCHRLVGRVVPVAWSGERMEILHKFHVNQTHCGAQKLFQTILRHHWWPGLS